MTTNTQVEELREKIQPLGLMELVSGNSFNGYQYLSTDTENKLLYLFTAQLNIKDAENAKALELAKIEAKIEELKELDFDDFVDRRSKVVVTLAEVEDRVKELTKQKEELLKCQTN